jgi:hypothetical protein
MSIRNLNRMFSPQSVAVIGASSRTGSIGAILQSALALNGPRGHGALRRPFCPQRARPSFREASFGPMEARMR